MELKSQNSWQLPAAVGAVARTLARNGHRVYVVGGALRDLLLGGQPSDWDLATSALPDQVLALVPDAHPTGVAYGTVTVQRAGFFSQVTTLRRDGAYLDGRHPEGVVFTDRIELDLARRDFTVNAMAWDLADGALIDPHGGAVDLERQILRAVGEPEARFSEDGLRIVRAARFVAQLSFELELETERALGAEAWRLAQVAPERIGAEVRHICQRAERPSRAFVWMQRAGALGHVFPCLVGAAGVGQNAYHRFDVLTHVLAAIDLVPKARWCVRLAALLHDASKPAHRARDARGVHFIDHERTSADTAAADLRRLALGRHVVERVQHLILHHRIQYEPEWTDRAVRRWVRRVGTGAVADLLCLARADRLATGMAGAASAVEALAERLEALTPPAALPEALAISGHQVMVLLKLEPGPQVGDALEAAWELVVNDPTLNTKDALSRHLIEWMKHQEGGDRCIP